MKKKLITVITVVFNACLTLEKTIRSVLDQDKSLVEYWIIDGGSTDGSLDIIRKYENDLAGWCSEPDEGIYDAMNKGINRANGRWIYFLGGDDTLRPSIIEKIQAYFNKDYSMVFGDVMFDNGHRMRSFLGPRTVLQNTVHHQSAFYNSKLFTNYRYDSAIRIVSEYDLHLQLYLKSATVLYIPLIIADCATGGASSELSRSLQETNLIRSRHVKNKIKNKMLSSFLKIYYAQKKIRFFLYGHRV